MTRLGAPHRDRRSGVLLVAAVALAVYANALPNGFAFDDVPVVQANESIQSWSTLPGAMGAPYWPSAYGGRLGLWRPVATGSFGALWMVGDGSPLPFHAANVLGHAIAAVLLFLLLTYLMPAAAALAAGLVFAVHPVHVEAVANVIGLSEIVSTVAVLAGCLLFVRGPDRVGWGRAALLALVYAIGFGAKESAVTLPGLLFLVDAARRRIAPADVGEYLADRWRAYAALAAVAVALLAGRYLVLGSVADPVPALGAEILAEAPRIWTLGEVWTHYVRLWVLPLELSSDYSPDVIPISLGWHAVNTLGAVLAVSVLATALVLWRRARMRPEELTPRVVAFGIVWFVIAISPTANVLFMSGVLLAERTLYLPSAGLAAATGWLVLRMVRERGAVAWGGLVVLLALASVRTWTRTPTWRSSSTVFSTLVNEYPQAGRSQWILGDQFLQVGDQSAALRSYRRAIGILGQDYTLLTGVARRLVEVGRYGAAEALLRDAFAAEPAESLAPALLASLRAEMGDVVGTERYARATLDIAPTDRLRIHLLAWALAMQGRWEEAEDVRSRTDGGMMPAFWHEWMYLALDRQRAGEPSADAALDSAWARASTARSRAYVDSVRVAEFSLPSRLATEEEPNSGR